MKQTLVFLTSLFLLLASCQNPVAKVQNIGAGSLVLSVGGSARTIAPSGTFIASFKASGSGPSGASSPTQTSSTGSFTFSGLSAGLWTFTVNGLDGEGTIASGSRTVTITTSGGQSVNVTLAPASGGTGSLSISASWSEDKPVTEISGDLTPGGGGDPITISLGIAGSSGTYSDSSLSPGSYVLVLTAKNGTTVIASTRVEAVLIYKGQTSSWSAEIFDNQFVSSAKYITNFAFTSPQAIGDVDEESRTVTVEIPSGTDLTALVPTVTYTGASISPEMGVAQDFTNPVTYTVTAADGSTNAYLVSVQRGPQ